MATTPLWLCHQCKKEIDRAKNPWTFHARPESPDYPGQLDDVVRFCDINCIATYYHLIKWPGRVPLPGVTVDAPE